METGINLIAIERSEQINKHGRTIEKDVMENSGEELRGGALALLTGNAGHLPAKWDPFICNKMMNKSYKEKLIIAGALIAAEIDRLNHEEVNDGL